MALSKKKLWQAQLENYPSSVRLTPKDMYLWCDSAPNPEMRTSRYVQISMALQYPIVVFYRIEGTHYMGFRMGVEGSQYMSLYSF